MDMETDDQRHVAFHLTGKRPESGLDALEELDLRPALLAHYRDLTRLRYDFPLVLVRGGGTSVQALSGIVDGIVREVAHGEDGERLARHVLRLELQIRALAAEGVAGSLSTLWEMAATRLASRTAEPMRESLRRARAALKLDGEVVDCDAATSARVMRHVWDEVQAGKATRFREAVGRLRLQLSNILRADFARSPAGRSAENLEASMGALHADDFDFAAMSGVLAKASPAAALNDNRRRRIGWLLSVLEAQRFYPSAAGDGTAAHGIRPYSFIFDDCVAALESYRARLTEVAEFAKAIAMAELEVQGEYNEARHESFFKEFGRDGLDPNDAAFFPSYLVRLNSSGLGAVENMALLEILSAGLPMKVIVQTDDILGESRFGDGRLGFGGRGQQLAHMAIGLGDVFVLQTCGSHLLPLHGRILDGIAYPGAAFFSVFSGAAGTAAGLPPYLMAAAAMESRAFPAFVYAPSAGPDWASRFDLGVNPQPAADWPVQRLAFEDEAHQKIAQDVAFTLADFVACDRRHARRFARVPRAKWTASMAPVGDCLAHEANNLPAKVPCVLMIDSGNVLQKIIVDGKLVREVLRCREMWRSLQELGGVNNSHAARLLARERKNREDREAEARASKPSPATENPIAAASASPPVEMQPERPPDEAYIDTSRCTTCNECTTINAKMFAYNENKQAYIADLAAGTYAQLVEAAESCQVAIIHPGKPRDPNEPGLAGLLKRAEAFA